MPIEEKYEISPEKLCPRCNTNKGEVVLRSKDIYCKPCLLQYLNHKFRAALGKSKMMRPQDKVLVAFSGSHSSMALLHLLQEGMQQSSHKRILFSVCALYIDDGSISKVSINERTKINTEIMSAMKYFDSYFTCIEQALDLGSIKLYKDVAELPLEVNADDSEMNKLFNTVTTLSSKQHLLQTLRQNLLLEIAKLLNCTKIFTAESQTDLATKIIANIALGKGAHVPIDVGFSDDRVDDIVTLRPLRDFSSKEVIYYNMFNNLTAVHVPSLATLADPLGSLQKAAESFVSDLQTNFPSTVSTVFRTADKLSLDLTSMNAASTCALCKAPLDTRADLASSSRGATKFSSQVSNGTKEELGQMSITPDPDNHVSCSAATDSTEDGTREDSSHENVQNTLCYACQYVVKDMKIDREAGEEILKKCLLSAVEEQIQEFVL